jgi:DNA-binding Xre family transcriptional regulator
VTKSEETENDERMSVAKSTLVNAKETKEKAIELEAKKHLEKLCVLLHC